MKIHSKKDSSDTGRASERGSRGAFSSVKRYFKKLLAFFSSTVLFGMIYSGGTTQAILDMAFSGYIGWREAFQMAFIKSLQFGTIKAPQFLNEMMAMFGASRPITALINYAIPLAMLFVAYFYLVSFFVDLLDGREGEVFRYWFQAIITVAVMGLVFVMINGLFFFTGAEPTFDNQEIVEDIKEDGKIYDPVNGSEDVNNSVNDSTGGNLSDSALNQSQSVNDTMNDSGGLLAVFGGIFS